MKNILFGRRFAALLLYIFIFLPYLKSQSTPCQTNTPQSGDVAGSFFFNYGAATGSRSLQHRTNWAIGPSFVGPHSSESYFGFMGFWSRFIAPPGAPTVTATQGDLLDRIQVSWNLDVLSTPPEQGYQIYRDGIFLAQVDKSVKSYNDFNVIAGRPYIYEIRGMNQFGTGASGTALGFQVPNGVVTGWVQTLNGNPVPDALVTLMPMQGFSLKMAANQGAGVDNTGISSFLPTHVDSTWSLCFWVKTQAVSGDAGLLTLTTTSPPLALHLRGIVGGQPGISVSYQSTTLSKVFDSPGHDGWQHVALTYERGRYRLFLNGVLVSLMPGSPMLANKELLLGALAGDGSGGWAGQLDELRLYNNVVLDEISLAEVMEGTASRLTPGLKYYWKMDEELGDKSFDIVGRRRLYFCGAKFDADRPPVRTAGKTNDDGYYRIESANYGTGTTFLAEPMKNFYKHRALKFDRHESDYATLPNFPVTPKATLELWVNSAGADGDQVLLSKRWGGTNDFRLLLRQDPPLTGVENHIIFYLNGGEYDFGTLGNNYQHLAFTIENGVGNTIVKAYKNGIFLNTANLPPVTGDWSGSAEPWFVGARKNGGAQTDYFDGLMDEVALYDSTLAQTTILEHAQSSRNPQERGLRVYFAMDEGSGNRLNNAGSYLSGFGTTFGTNWTTLAPNQQTTPHVFTPKNRQVTLNPSITSVDQVDFTDRSTVAVSGFVRYEGTDCFVNRAEILVNGEPFKPQIFTDSLGRFTIDFEPGTTATLSVKYENHNFIPASWEVINLTSPVAGVLFSDVTKRKITGQIAGGNCKASIIKPIDDCRLTVRTLDGCFERTDTVQVTNGKFELKNLPPLEVTIAITKHNNPQVYQFFQTLGGRRINLTQKDSSGVNFIYFAPPSVDVAGFSPKICKGQTTPTLDIDGNPLIVIEELQKVKLTVTVFEQYVAGGQNSGTCPLDSAQLSISNTFDLKYDFVEPLDTMMRNKKFEYEFVAAYPNPDPPYLKIMQVTADVDGRKGTYTRRVLITGIIKGEKKFTTASPMVPNFVLRDPPGDGSSAFMEKGETICNTMAMENGGGAGPFFTLDALAGPGTEISGPFIPTTKIKAYFGITSEFDLRILKTSTTSMDYCLTATERISTDDGELVVGGKTSLDGGKTLLAGNDVYVGTAFNFIISDSRYVRFNDTTCSVKLNSVTTFQPDSFATTYVYSEWNIENNVIRYLDSLILDTNGPQKASFQQSKQRWLDFIKLNTEAKAKAKFKRNISWDAGSVYDYSQTRDTTIQADSQITEKFEGLLGFYLNAEGEGAGSGTKLELKVGSKFEGTFSQTSGNMTQRGTTVGYTLKDNDPGDTWTMDVKDDPIFKTPVFNIKAGQTSCPWEVGTAHREGVKLISVDGNTRLNVPSNGEASFQFLLQNNSQTGETFSYALTTGPESNPDGLQIFLNGGPLDKYVFYALPWGEPPLPVTITVKRGPKAYLYENVELVFLSACHDLRANALGFAGDFEPYLYSAVYLTVQFEEPCSEVDISFPQEGWVVKPDKVNPAAQDILPITISKYDKKDADLLGVRLQYRPVGGDGAWINITGGMPDYIPKDSLGDLFEVYYWNTGGTPPLSDGEYEIRAIALCSGAPTDNPGISHIIKGRIERQPPALLGVPEPSDGVFNVGDEISFSFNKSINCNKLLEADIFNANNVGLYDATTDKLIDVDISCRDNKIILEPKFQNQFFENKIIRAEIHNIQDKTGNTLGFEKWEFFVDRNELGWLTDSLGVTKYEDDARTGIANIHNRGGSPMNFTILGAPDWVRVVPNKGTLAPNEVRPIRFEVDSSLAFGHWRDTVILHTETGQNPFFMGGDEPLPMGVRVVCRPPDWDLRAGLYENTMNMVLQLNIQGQLSTDEEDIVVAYVNDTLVGRARVQYVPQLNKYLAYLTVYGNPYHKLLPLKLEIWDASACLRYAVVESFQFFTDALVGNPGTPQVVHTNSLVVREVPLGFGWNWISLNLGFTDPSLDDVLAPLKHPENGLIRSQGPFAIYHNPSGQWVGSLATLHDSTMYVYRTDRPDTLKIAGTLLDPAVNPIRVKTGWNWIGYIPNYSLPINRALSSLPSQPGDVVKSQTAFAFYMNPTFGWIGNLKFMQPPNGYQLKAAMPGTLTYPSALPNKQGGGTELRGDPETPPVSFWRVDPALYEHSMTLIGMIQTGDQNATSADMELGAFVGNEVRGSAQAIWIEPLKAHLFFLTIYANTNGEPLHFKLYEAATGRTRDLNDRLTFIGDLHQGSLDMPVPFTLTSTAAQDLAAVRAFEIHPNPFQSETVLRFDLQQAQDVVLTITDPSGRACSRLRTRASAGPNTVTWDGHDDTGARLGSGVYFARLQTEAGSVCKRVVLQR